jgi:hypothetical protein
VMVCFLSVCLFLCFFVFPSFLLSVKPWTSDLCISISISIYLRSFDLRKGYCLDIEHVISIHNTMRYQIYNLSQYKIVGYRSCQYIIQCDTGE